MELTVDIQVVTEDDDHPPPESIERWVKAALMAGCDNVPDEAELTVRIVDTAEITQLNHQYRGKDSATNVLSFPADVPDHIDLPLLGDLVICSVIVEQEALEQQKTSMDHWAHMVVHGTLHLLGYDHIENSDAEIMEALEIKILASMQINNPYSHIPDNQRVTIPRTMQ